MTGLRGDEITFHLAQCLNALGHLASPTAWKATQQGVEPGKERPGLRQGILVSINGAAEILGANEGEVDLPTGPVNGPGVTEALKELFLIAQGWHDGPPPPELVTAARNCLELFGVPEPPGGWQHFGPAVDKEHV